MKSYITIAFLALIVLLTSGCVNNNPQLDKREAALSVSVDDFIRNHLVRASGSGPYTFEAAYRGAHYVSLTKPHNYLANYCESKGGGFIPLRIHPMHLSIYYTPGLHDREEDRKTIRNDIRDSFGVFSCEKNGHSQWVVDISNSGTLRTFTGMGTTQVTNITIAATNKTNFTQKLAQQDNKVKEYHAAQQREHMKYLENTDKKKIKGTALCKDTNGYVYLAFTEDSGAENIKINIVNAYLKGSPNIHPGGFSVHTTWDSPNNWYLCSVVQNQ